MNTHLVPRITGMLTLVTTLGLASIGPAAAAPGGPDPGFGTGGRVTIDDGTTDGAFALAVQPDGKIVVAGYTDKAGSVDTLVFRLNPDGSEDLGFGRQRLAVPGGRSDYPSAVTLQADGKIVIAGRTETNEDGTIWRLLPSGAPDATFGGGDGLVIVDNGAREYLSDVAVAPNGAIVTVGQSGTPNSGLAAIFRFTPTGEPDKTFDEDGKLGMGGGYSRAEGVAVQPDGKIVVSGYFGDISTHGLQVRRLQVDGETDYAFGEGDGEASAYGVQGTGDDVLVQPDGRIVVVGSHFLPSGRQTGAAVRYTASGRADTTFNGPGDRDGRIFDTPGIGTALVAVAALPGGGYVVSGYRRPAELAVSGVAFRLGPDGAADPAFGTGGRVDLSGGSRIAYDVAVQTDGKVVLAGVGDQNRDAIVHRLLTATDPGPTTTPTCQGRPATLVGTAGKDRLRGTKRADVIVALAGNDVVQGLGGNDLVCAGDGSDRVVGGPGKDRLYGEAGRDRLIGGIGKDRLVGGPDRDVVSQRS